MERENDILNVVIYESKVQRKVIKQYDKIILIGLNKSPEDGISILDKAGVIQNGDKLFHLLGFRTFT